VNLVVPLKSLAVAKSRLLGALDPVSRTELVLAMAMDTVAAAVAAHSITRVLVAATEPAELAPLRDLGADIVDDGGSADLNSTLTHGAQLLRADDPQCIVGALQGDLPALQPAELDAAVAAAGGRRAFFADRAGSGTTLLLSTPGGPLEPRFGPQSAKAHAASGAAALELPLPTLRSDVDTPDDLAHARRLGAGPHTRAALLAPRRAC
jgi:2-phospho-L-lactate guanylyltransferase